MTAKRRRRLKVNTFFRTLQSLSTTGVCTNSPSTKADTYLTQISRGRNKEEKVLVRKTEWKVTFWAFFVFVAVDLDGGSMSQANADNLLDDLDLSTNDMNLGKTINLIYFLSAELPFELICKKIGLEVWITLQLLQWSIVCMREAFLQNKHQYLTCRALVGLLEGGFIPDILSVVAIFL